MVVVQFPHAYLEARMMELTNSVKALLIETAKSLKGSARRVFMARTVKELGPGGQRRAASELGWGPHDDSQRPA
jgi:hypothetical protein